MNSSGAFQTDNATALPEDGKTHVDGIVKIRTSVEIGPIGANSQNDPEADNDETRSSARN